jgi:hypothetical protein
LKSASGPAEINPFKEDPGIEKDKEEESGQALPNRMRMSIALGMNALCPQFLSLVWKFCCIQSAVEKLRSL